MVIARCALESVRDSISTMLGKEAFCLDDEAANLLIVGEQLAVTLTTMPICAAEEISLELGKIQSVMSGALAMSVSRDTPGFRFLQATVHELSAFMLLIQRAEDNHKAGPLPALK
ncbi:hypothetical protein EC845_2543 [Comamonas sp. BIGb0124]|nr:hypothetical protein EC845_2543 [Comamonas sp. BIGb0124]